MQDVKYSWVALGEPEDPFYELLINGMHHCYCVSIEAVGARIEDYKSLVLGQFTEAA